ncbi:MAG: hypothetical protein SH857_08090 [Chitinophagales bacterium]|nr:hypothetical protein [Chitinophagales bacterium]
MDSNKPHDCSEVVSRMFLALDGELTTPEEKEFLDELNRCSWCLEHYHVEKTFKQFLSNRLARKEINPAMIEEIKSKIKNSSVEE